MITLQISIRWSEHTIENHLWLIQGRDWAALIVTVQSA